MSNKPRYLIHRYISLLPAVFLTVLPLYGEEANFTMGSLFSDGAVLQRGKPVPVWGQALPGEEVKVEFGDQSKSAIAGTDGRWMVRLNALEASAKPVTLRAILVRNATILEATDILVGDVWFCSGQSNMSYAVEKTPNSSKEIASAKNLMIRGWRSPLTASAKPEFSNQGRWVSCQADPDSEDGLKQWSGVAFYFAREIYRETNIPIGIIMTSYGGTEIEAWMGPAALRDSGLNEAVQNRWQRHMEKVPLATEEWKKNLAKWEQGAAEAAKRGEKMRTGPPRAPEGNGTRSQPSALYNAMVAPFVPFGIRGFLWYQGESNASRPEEYARLFSALIRSWRSDFSQGDLPFYFVQLPNFERAGKPPARHWAALRAAQASVLALPHTGMAVTIDVGEADELHPKNKQDVGRRLARYALKNEYGKSQPVTGPVFSSARADGSGMRVMFAGNPGLELRDGSGAAFEVAGTNRNFFPASARIEGAELVVASPQVPEPVAVRYAWWNNPAAILFGGGGLPAAPFRSDDWAE